MLLYPVHLESWMVLSIVKPAVHVDVVVSDAATHYGHERGDMHAFQHDGLWSQMEETDLCITQFLAAPYAEAGAGCEAYGNAPWDDLV